MSGPSCWIVTEGAAGMESQCRGVAEALALEPVVKRADPRRLWLALPTRWWPFPFLAMGGQSGRFEPPWPDVLISCGRKSVAISRAVKRASGGRTFHIHVQDPMMSTVAFDLVAPPRHDGVKGKNVVATRGALHPITPEKLAAAAERFRPHFAHLPRPLVAVLVGGPNGRVRFDRRDAERIADELVRLARTYGAGLVLTPSRRTTQECARILGERLKEVDAYLWDRSGENPYLGMLALADYILVTADSVSLASEACATGKPVYVIALSGGSRRHRRFHEALRAEGLTRPFAGKLERWSYAPLLDAEVVAAEARRLIEGRARANSEPAPA